MNIILVKKKENKSFRYIYVRKYIETCDAVENLCFSLTKQYNKQTKQSQHAISHRAAYTKGYLLSGVIETPKRVSAGCGMNSKYIKWND